MMEDSKNDSTTLELENAQAENNSSEDQKPEDQQKPVYDSDSNAEGTELEAFEAAEIEQQETLDEQRIMSIVESLLFSTDRPQTVSTLKHAFKGTQVSTKDIKQAIEKLRSDYAASHRGVALEEVSGGYQLRTKTDNMSYLKGTVKAKPFKLSGPAMEVMAIVAYEQPCVKSHVDEIRGVESGHLLRALMEKQLIRFGGKSDLPGKPMLYETTKKFLETFGLRNITELPSLSEIDELIPEGMGESEEEQEELNAITDSMTDQVGSTYSQGEDELQKITNELSDISTTSEFFEEEKKRQKEKKEAEKAQNIREALETGEEVSEKDKKWLKRYDERVQAEDSSEGSDVPQDEGTAGSEPSAEAEDRALDAVNFAAEEYDFEQAPSPSSAKGSNEQAIFEQQSTNATDEDLASESADSEQGLVDTKTLEKDLEVFEESDPEDTGVDS